MVRYQRGRTGSGTVQLFPVRVDPLFAQQFRRLRTGLSPAQVKFVRAKIHFIAGQLYRFYGEHPPYHVMYYVLSMLVLAMVEAAIPFHGGAKGYRVHALDGYPIKKTGATPKKRPPEQLVVVPPPQAVTPIGRGRSNDEEEIISAIRQLSLVPAPGHENWVAPTGLTNMGNTCYQNSAFQVFVHLLEFSKSSTRLVREILNNYAAIGEPAPSIPFLPAFANFVAVYNAERRQTPPSPSRRMDEAMHYLVWTVKNVHVPFREALQEEDTSELMDVVIENVHDDFRNLGVSDVENPAIQSFRVATTRYQSCTGCRRPFANVEPAWKLVMYIPQVPRRPTVQQLVDHTVRVAQELVEVNCEFCPSKTRHSIVGYTTLPRFIYLQVSRFKYEFDGGMMVQVKDNSPIQVTKWIQMPLMVDVGSTVPRHCRLRGVISHIGNSMEEGHYISYVFNTLDERWYECNDDRVRQIKFDSFKTKIEAEAYVLVYEQIEGAPTQGFNCWCL